MARIEHSRIVDLLDSLTAKSFIVYDADAPGGGRFRMLETVRQYAQERLAGSGEDATVRVRHRSRYLALSEEAFSHHSGPGAADWLRRLEAEHDNLRASLTQCAADPADGAVAGLRLCGALAGFWLTRGHLSEGRMYCRRALFQPGTSAYPALRAKALGTAGNLAFLQGDPADAEALFAEALSLWEALGDVAGIALQSVRLGMLANERGDYAVARSLYERGLFGMRQVGNTVGIAGALNGLGNVAFQQGDCAAARSFFEEFLADARARGDRQAIAIGLGSLGNAALENGEIDTARILQTESLLIKRELEDVQGIARTLRNLAEATFVAGDSTRSGRLFVESITLFRDLGDAPNCVASIEGFACLAGAEGRPAGMRRATRFWSFAEAFRAALQWPLPQRELVHQPARIRAAQQILGAKAFAEAWAEGQTLTLEQAIVDALKETDDEH